MPPPLFQRGDKMKLMAIDPSFTCTGIAMYLDGKFILDRVKLGTKAGKTFEDVWKKGCEVTNEVVKLCRKYQPEQILSEIPPPVAGFSAGLWSLDTLLLYRLAAAGAGKIYIMQPNYIGQIHGRRKYPKSESTKLAKNIIDLLKYKSDMSSMKTKINNDEAEAFILLCRLLVRNHIFEGELSHIEGLFMEKEKELNYYAK